METKHSPGNGRLTCPRRHMPEGWDPPAPAWSARFDRITRALVVAIFTTEDDKRRAQTTRLDAWFDQPDGPVHVERAEYTARSGDRATITVAYWCDPDRHRAWCERDFDAWWRDPARLSEPAAHALEVLTIPPDRLETIFGHAEHAGAVGTGQSVYGPVQEHLYWGSMRDRIPAAAQDPLASLYGHNLPQADPGETRGRRLRVIPPANLCVIRSGQSWAGCDAEELALYDASVRPALHAGMRYLRDHRAETGCLDLRFANEIGRTDEPLARAFGLGIFLSLGHLEAWAAHHPTHLAIFERMVDLATVRGDKLALRLWHEVFVLPGEGQRFEYINCAPNTGLLPCFQASDL